MPTRNKSVSVRLSTVQRFGGPWSLVKTEMVEKYIRFFTTALKNQPFERVYIDAFAGSGAFRYIGDEPANSLFPRDAMDHVHAGSAARALQCVPAFDRIYFFENRKRNVRALERLIAESGHPAAMVEHGDANDGIRKLCRKDFWRNKRGVIFLDPFGMSVAWSTLALIAETEALDVWLLFPLSGLVRNLARSADRLDDGKRRAITRSLGTEDWFERFYKIPSAPTMRLFDDEEPVRTRTATVNDVEAYVAERLKTIFARVEAPKRLMTPRNQSLFSLFFAVSNPKAVAVAVRGARHILKHN